jgi:protein-S-isoprenylcysteine O-methyltransferase Ste14
VEENNSIYKYIWNRPCSYPGSDGAFVAGQPAASRFKYCSYHHGYRFCDLKLGGFCADTRRLPAARDPDVDNFRPLLAAQMGSISRLTFIDFAGLVVWVIGFFCEAVGDIQLTRFKANPTNRGKVLNSGVWKMTRHPNYFGDSAQWWGYYLIAAAAGGWWTIFSPLLMTLFLLRVSGVALLERTMESRPGYKEYIESTSAFIPLVSP